jgi:FlaA1/EpsC-like NDP-sugar epimerase
MPIVFTKLLPGEKLTEEMVFAGETVEPTGDARLQRVRGAAIAAADFDRKIARLVECAELRDLVALVDTLVRIVPEYEPSELLLGLPKPLVRAATK